MKRKFTVFQVRINIQNVMSRSTRKPWVKDSKPSDNSYNKIFRRVNKQRIKSFKEPLLMRELINDYDICDWNFYNPEDEWKYRK